MIYSKLEIILVLLPPSERDDLLKKLDDDALLELECTSRAIHTSLRQSNQYWRGCYGRSFHWQYVEHEQDFLMWYRNKIWREFRRGKNAPVDLLDNLEEHWAFSGVNWKMAYQYRLTVQDNWLGKHHRQWHYDEYSPETISGIHIMPTSASSIPLKLVNQESVRLTYLRPAEMPGNITTALNDIPTLSTFDKTEDGHARHVKPIISNGCYTVVEARNTFFVRPTYSDDKWVPFEIPGFSYHHNDFKRTITFGRWVVFRGYSDQDPIWLVNLATCQYSRLPLNIQYVHAIIAAETDSVVLLTAPTASSQYRIDWRQYRCDLLTNGLVVDLLSKGYFCITAKSDRVAISRLGPDYVYVEYQNNGMYPTLAIYDANVTGGQEPLCCFEEAWPAYRLDRTTALVETQYFCNIVDLVTGDILHAYSYGALLNLKPILGGFFLSTGKNSTQIIDVYSGIPKTTIVTTKQVNWPLIEVYSTFLFFKPISGAVSIFDFTL
ncbi:hypothetical protein BDF19DRAFT_450454, partial [Syncephalis fuscata]